MFNRSQQALYFVRSFSNLTRQLAAQQTMASSTTLFTPRLAGKSVCIFVDFNYEDLEVHYPLIRLQEEGAKVVLVASQANNKYTGKHGYPCTSDKSSDEVSRCPDYLRRNKKMVQMTIEMHQQGKPIASICHGPWLLCSAKVDGVSILKGKKATSFVAIKDDVENAGATWVDEAVVTDSNIITSRHPKDLTPFCHAIIEAMVAAKL